MRVVQVFFILLIANECFSVRSGKKKNSLARHFAKKIVAAIPEHYMDYMRAEPRSFDIDPTGKCDDVEKIEEYFFNVYSSQNGNPKNNLSMSSLEEIVKFQKLRGVRDDEYERKSLFYRCSRQNCFKAKDIFSMKNYSSVTQENFKEVCPFLLYNNELDDCIYIEDGDVPLSEVTKWVVGLLFSGIVTIWSWNGFVVFPIITTKLYSRVLSFMIALAFACMSSNSLLNYVPMSDGFTENDLEESNSFFYKHLVILLVIFAFFCFERSMKLYTIWKTKKRRVQKEMDKRIRKASRIYDLDELEDDVEDKMNKEEEKMAFQARMLRKGISIDVVDINIIGNAGMITLNDTSKFEEQQEENVKLCCTSLSYGMSDVRPVGWMAIFGDGLGNFIDGLSIGAAINQGITAGFTTALATWASNIPQELGDFALLSRAGMSPFQALFYNYMSGNTAYIGCIIGLTVGSDLDSAKWIFAISAGTTLFLSLGVLLPEVNEEFESSSESFIEKCKLTLVQISGMLVGYTVIVILNIYEESIEI